MSIKTPALIMALLATAWPAATVVAQKPARPLLPSGTATGTVTVDGKVMEVHYAYAVAQPLRSNASLIETIVLLTEKPLPEGTLGGENDLWGAVAGKHPGWVYYSVLADGKPHKEALEHSAFPGRVPQRIGPRPGQRFEGLGSDRIFGSVDTPGVEKLGSFAAYEAHVRFNAPMVGSGAAATVAFARAGQPLPPDGGEPGKAYVALCQAIQRNDPVALRGLGMGGQVKLPPAQVEMMLKGLTAAWPANPKLVDGFIMGDRALLHVTGVREKATLYGTIEMEKRAGGWVVTNTTWDDKPPRSVSE